MLFESIHIEVSGLSSEQIKEEVDRSKYYS